METVLNTLYVYVDECGLPPLDDHDKPYVAAAASALQPVSDTRSLRFDVDLLLGHMARNHATAFLAHVSPFPGYGQRVAAKFGKMDTMAKARKLVTGVHEYLPAGGLRVRNTLYSHCISQAVGQALTKHAFRGAIERLVVTFDQMTLAPENRRMVIDECRKVPRRLADVAASYRTVDHRHVEQLEGLLNNLQITPTDIVIQWSDEPGAAGTADGLHLADRLAWHYRKHLEKPTNPTSFLDHLSGAGHTDITFDVTPVVVTPIDRDSIDRWERDTGLPEPMV
jgi:hypothetical protein